MRKWFLIIGLVITGLSQAQEEERLEMEGTAIIGNQELPKMLYIVPWKPSTLPNLAEPPLQSLIDEALEPVDREVFRREVYYYDELAEKKAAENENQ